MRSIKTTSCSPLDRCNNDLKMLFPIPVESQIQCSRLIGGKLSPFRWYAKVAKCVEGKYIELLKGKNLLKKILMHRWMWQALRIPTGVSQDELLSRFKGAVINPNLQLLFKIQL